MTSNGTQDGCSPITLHSNHHTLRVLSRVPAACAIIRSKIDSNPSRSRRRWSVFRCSHSPPAATHGGDLDGGATSRVSVVFANLPNGHLFCYRNAALPLRTPSRARNVLHFVKPGRWTPVGARKIRNSKLLRTIQPAELPK